MTLPSAMPEPVLIDLTGGPTLRWGIIAPGFIAGRFCVSVLSHTDQRIVAVGSRSMERAQEFARTYEIARAYGDYTSVIESDEVDAVYVAAPHTLHVPIALEAIAAGKHVLVEKPLAPSAAEARLVADAARSAGVYVMEAMHTRFHPRTTILARLLEDGALGEIRSVQADIGFKMAPDPSSRLFAPELAGGAVLDLGVYAIWFATFVLGRPAGVHVAGSLTSTGVDRQSVVVMDYSTGAQGIASSNLTAFTPSLASVSGTDGRVQFDSRMPMPGPLSVFEPNNVLKYAYADATGVPATEGMCRQAVWMARDVAEGRTESPWHSLDTSVAVLETIDIVRSRLGVTPHARHEPS